MCERCLAVIETDLSKIPTLRLSEGEKGRWLPSDASFRFTPESDAVTASLVISALPDGGCLRFFDGEHPKLTDDGAFAMYWRASDGIYVSWGNHGWTSNVIPITESQAAEYLRLCMRWHMTEDSDPCRMWDGVPRTRRPGLSALLGYDPTVNSRERNYLLRRLELRSQDGAAK